ncbi:hypothetical protein [Estrella lausannensis]|uniref:Protochlamydia outer membrane protein domain-containing protein n=1 Tax=Estrella lausannensis TaxID=483423 RepID=A0A0H5DUA5_9BACT|nr:hypothetical protein [Estrella lausannensis]CRX39509.1 hypothetical protein ELAC_2189 [Estrella lausannensis]
MGFGKALLLLTLFFFKVFNPLVAHDVLWVQNPYCDLGGGLREDSLSWSIAGPDGTPNVASLLSWKSIRSAEVSLDGGCALFNRWPVHIMASYGWIYSGKMVDEDFFGEDKSDLFLKSRAKASRGKVFNLSFDAGRTFCLKRGIQFTPLAGYRLSGQNLKQFHGFTEVNLIDPDDVGPIEGLNSGYNARWYGPFVGFKADIPLFGGFLGFGFDYHYPRYSARGKANLRTDILGDYIHRSQGFGKEFFARYQAAFRELCLFELKLKWGKFWTKRGDETETVETADQGRVPVKVDLNRVEWKSKSVSAHLIKKF